MTIGEGADGARVYATRSNPGDLVDAPPVDENRLCDSRERHDWAVTNGGYAEGVNLAFVYLFANRSDTTVLVTDFKPTVRRVPGVFNTAIVPCADDVGTGGETPFVRKIELGLAQRPVVQFRNEEDKQMDRLSLQLIKGESAELQILTSIDDAGVGYEWFAELTILVDGQEERKRVPEKGYLHLANLSEEPVYWSDDASPTICYPNVSKEDWC